MEEYKNTEDGLSIDEEVEVVESTIDGLEEQAKINAELNDNKIIENCVEQEEEIDTETEYKQILMKYSGDHKKALFEYCFIHNIFFSNKILDSLLKNATDSDYNNMPCLYVDYIDNDPNYSCITFFEQIHLENFEDIYSEELTLIGLSEESKKDRQQIISIIGYDPFDENLIEDKPQLYRDLTGMLTDGMRKDIPKAKAAVEVVTGYNNIRKYQKRVNDLINKTSLDDDEQKQLDKTLEMITKIQNSINAINDKNGFSNSKSLGNNGRGMLSDVMKTIDEHMYDKGYVNAYDIETSKSIQQIADISNNSILTQVKLTGQDMVDMLTQQAETVHKAQKTSRQALEALRICKGMLKREELIEKLEKEYKDKDISEDDIQEFINREYKMWEK